MPAHHGVSRRVGHGLDVPAVDNNHDCPAPSGVVCVRLPRDIGEGQVPVVLPQEVPFAHVLIGDVRDEDVQKTVVVVIAPVDIHSLLGVDADGRLRDVGKGPVAVVCEEPIRSEVAGDVEIAVSIVVRVGMTQIQSPAAQVETGRGRDVRECAVPIVAVDEKPAPVVCGFETLREEARCLGFEDVNILEVAAHEQIEVAVPIVIEGNRGDGIHVSV